MIREERLGRYTLLQSEECFKLGADSLRLAAFATVKRGWRVFDLGCGVGTALHTDTFTVDEACLPIGAAMQACLALRVLKGDRV